jgi:hypothetical protein
MPVEPSFPNQATILERGNVVILPCEPENFKEFISGLLGQQQTINRTIVAPYEIGREEIANLFALLEQRIKLQNRGSLVSLSVRIEYNDNSSVTLNSIDQFSTYGEIKPLISVGLMLQWTWLIQFPDRDVPEKQDINVYFKSVRDHILENEIAMRSGQLAVVPRIRSGRVEVAISHTNRTWGTDIDSLIEGFIGTIKRPIPVWKRTVEKSASWVSILTAVALSIGGLLTVHRFFQLAAAQAFHKQSELWNKSGYIPAQLKTLEVKLDYILNGGGPQSSVIGLAAIISYIFVVSVAVTFGIVVHDSITTTEPSFIKLTPQAIRISDEWSRDKSREPRTTFIGIAVTIALAIVANLITPYVVELLPL